MYTSLPVGLTWVGRTLEVCLGLRHSSLSSFAWPAPWLLSFGFARSLASDVCCAGLTGNVGAVFQWLHRVSDASSSETLRVRNAAVGRHTYTHAHRFVPSIYHAATMDWGVVLVYNTCRPMCNLSASFSSTVEVAFQGVLQV